MHKIILINVSGSDRPGLTSSLAEALAGFNVRVLDIGQAVVHETLALAILIEIPEGHDFTPLKKDLLVRAHELDLKIKFTPVSGAVTLPSSIMYASEAENTNLPFVISTCPPPKFTA